jgi:hypothetical protein
MYTFEMYWNEHGITTSVPLMEEAFKEVARKAWNAAISGRPHQGDAVAELGPYEGYQHWRNPWHSTRDK